MSTGNSNLFMCWNTGQGKIIEFSHFNSSHLMRARFRVKGPCWHEMPNSHIGIDSGPMVVMKPNGHHSKGMLPQKLQIMGLSWSDMPSGLGVLLIITAVS